MIKITREESIVKKYMLLPLLILGFVISVFGFQYAQADGNFENTRFFFNFDDIQQTDPREKLDSTSAYMKADNISGGDAYKAWVSMKDGEDMSGGNHYTVRENREYFMTNYVVETYGTHKLIRIQGREIHGTGTFAASGVWSPDSI